MRRPVIFFGLIVLVLVILSRLGGGSSAAGTTAAAPAERVEIGGQSAFITVAGRLACAGTDELEVAQSMASDAPALTDYVRAHDCTILRGGDTVVLAPGSGVLTIRFRVPGTAAMLYAANGSIERLSR